MAKTVIDKIGEKHYNIMHTLSVEDNLQDRFDEKLLQEELD